MEDPIDYYNQFISKLKFEDITSRSLKVQTQLSNSLIHHESFLLYDSMSGIEIMNPKMDLKADLDNIDTVQTLISSK